MDAPKSVPIVAATQPAAVETEAGKIYFWCVCGKSTNQPFCDGSHKGGELQPMKWQAELREVKWFCQCKQTRTPPFCDGSHKNLLP